LKIIDLRSIGVEARFTWLFDPAGLTGGAGTVVESDLL